jgi:hypothetical protein
VRHEGVGAAATVHAVAAAAVAEVHPLAAQGIAALEALDVGGQCSSSWPGLRGPVRASLDQGQGQGELTGTPWPYSSDRL